MSTLFTKQINQCGKLETVAPTAILEQRGVLVLSLCERDEKRVDSVQRDANVPVDSVIIGVQPRLRFGQLRPQHWLYHQFNTALYDLRPSFPGCRAKYLEQSAVGSDFI